MKYCTQDEIFNDTKLDEKIFLLELMADTNDSIKKYYNAIMDNDVTSNIYTKEDLSEILNIENILELLTPDINLEIITSFQEHSTGIALLINDNNLLLTDLELFGIIKKYKKLDYYKHMEPELVESLFNFIIPSIVRDEKTEVKTKHLVK